MKYNISSNSEYHTALARIESLLEKGPDKLSKKETNELADLSIAVEKFEEQKYPMPIPVTIVDYLNNYLLEKNITQVQLAKLLKVPPPYLSALLRGKKKINLRFAKKLHEILKIDGNFILEAS